MNEWRSEGGCFVHAFQNCFLLSYTTTETRNGSINVGSVDLDSWKVSFGDIPALHSDRSDLSTSYNVQAALLHTPIVSMKTFILYLLNTLLNTLFSIYVSYLF